MRCALVTGVQTCALPIWFRLGARLNAKTHACHVPRGDTEQAASPHLLRGRVMADGSARATSFISTQEHRRFTEFANRSEEHTSELQSLMRISYAVFCLKKKKNKKK